MSGVDEIDERRAKVIADCIFAVHGEWAMERSRHFAKLIRLSDEAAGYILIKHEGVISSEGMKPVEGE